jgi:hypothetical protein
MIYRPDLRTRILVIFNVLGLAGVLLLNTLANALPIHGLTTGAVSALYPNLFVPAGYTFAIWGLIYLALTVFVVVQVVAIWRGGPDDWSVIRRIGPLFFMSCVANMTWIIAWHHQELGLSMALMTVILACLIGIYVRVQSIGGDPARRLAYQAPFSMYLGWICVATVANAAALLVGIGWEVNPAYEPLWAKGMILVSGTLGLLFILARKDILLGLTIAWGVGGIFVRHYQSGDDWQVGKIALGAVIALVAAVLFRLYRLVISR